MATMNTTDVKHVREDLVDAINDISPESTPFMSLIGSTKASNTFHEYLRDELSDPNPNNAAIEGADAPEAVQVGPIREGNWTQIFTEVVSVSGTLQAVNTAGTKDELGRQIAKKGKEMKRSIEAAFVSANASVATGARKLGGAEACIKTNADHGIGGSTAGYNNGTIGAVVAGTVRDFEEDMFLDMSSRVWQHHDTDLTVFVNAPLKRAISQFNGNATKFQKAETSKIYANVDYYQTDFGLIKVLPHRSVSPTTVLAFDPSLWAAAYVRKFDKKALGRTGDADKFQLLTEVTLECRNEKGNGKIADVQAATV